MIEVFKLTSGLYDTCIAYTYTVESSVCQLKGLCIYRDEIVITTYQTSFHRAGSGATLRVGSTVVVTTFAVVGGTLVAHKEYH
jgi:hypothetical protein